MKTVVIGASTNPSRYSYIASSMLKDYGFEFIPVGIKKGSIFKEEILNLRDKPSIENVHTITLYLGPQNQREWYDYILKLNPTRIIFNPGTENLPFINRLKEEGIEPVVACTLVMLSTRQY